MEPRNYDTSEFGTEAFRYFSPTHRGLICVLKEGTILLMEATEPNWRILFQKKAEIDADTWLQGILAGVRKLPAWAQEVTTLPEISQIETWVFDSVCETVTGDEIEPDGTGPDGAPSWLIAFGLI